MNAHVGASFQLRLRLLGAIMACSHAATKAPCLHAAGISGQHQRGGPEVERDDAGVKVDV
jgi:hypothetical protein